jgi:hypothetical protein
LPNCWSCSYQSGLKGVSNSCFETIIGTFCPQRLPFSLLSFSNRSTPPSSPLIFYLHISPLACRWRLRPGACPPADARHSRRRGAAPDFFYRPVGDYHRPAVRVYRNCINGYHYLPLKFKFSN